jgi:hypothetical protein
MGKEVCVCYGSDRSQLVLQDLVSRSRPGKQVLLIEMALPALHRLRPLRPSSSIFLREGASTGLEGDAGESVLKMGAE